MAFAWAPVWAAIAVGAAMAGCARSPAVVVTNVTDRPVYGYVQIPSVVVAGYPARSSRERFKLAPGDERRFRRRHGREHRVDNWSSVVHIAVRRSDQRWHLASVDGRGVSRLEAAIAADEHERPRVNVLDAHASESVVESRELWERLGARAGG